LVRLDLLHFAWIYGLERPDESKDESLSTSSVFSWCYVSYLHIILSLQPFIIPFLSLSCLVTFYQTDSNRASTTTIIRFPYLRTMTDKADFLYATTNVGILSTSEIGIGITTCAAATLRPLFRRFLGRTQLDSTPVELSDQCRSNPPRAGYSRNRGGGQSADEEYISMATETRTQRDSTERLENARRDVGHASESKDASIEDNRPASIWEPTVKTGVTSVRTAEV
jgi:hypothetical protein